MGPENEIKIKAALEKVLFKKDLNIERQWALGPVLSDEMVAKEDSSRPLVSSFLKPTLWARPANYETTTYEAHHAGSLRLTVVGTRKIAAVNTFDVFAISPTQELQRCSFIVFGFIGQQHWFA